MRTLSTLAAPGQMRQTTHTDLPSGRDIVSAAALTELAFEAVRPMAFPDIDGEYLGETEFVAFRFVLDAVRAWSWTELSCCDRSEIKFVRLVCLYFALALAC